MIEVNCDYKGLVDVGGVITYLDKVYFMTSVGLLRFLKCSLDGWG